jgi:hypothetical protein
MYLQIMRSPLDPCTESMLFGKFDSGLYLCDRLDLGNIDWDESLFTGDRRIVVNITIAIAILPGCQSNE